MKRTDDFDVVPKSPKPKKKGTLKKISFFGRLLDQKERERDLWERRRSIDSKKNMSVTHKSKKKKKNFDETTEQDDDALFYSFEEEEVFWSLVVKTTTKNNTRKTEFANKIRASNSHRHKKFLHVHLSLSRAP